MKKNLILTTILSVGVLSTTNTQAAINADYTNDGKFLIEGKTYNSLIEVGKALGKTRVRN